MATSFWTGWNAGEVSGGSYEKRRCLRDVQDSVFGLSLKTEVELPPKGTRGAKILMPAIGLVADAGSLDGLGKTVLADRIKAFVLRLLRLVAAIPTPLFRLSGA
jgi:hypothetical protein